ncbi:hypothetical protein Pmani_034251 [Petrolisthes manimaculis]|uniref:Uncharacterized protein n=1 Tax=Petrolisthes manimaculis TaxID=1843537 RepID=A0AAE1NP01_9EUCA|nr:hypothetical protein Pmani_034251 [Petrolisthes manimaculis]
MNPDGMNDQEGKRKPQADKAAQWSYLSKIKGLLRYIGIFHYIASLHLYLVHLDMFQGNPGRREQTLPCPPLPVRPMRHNIPPRHAPPRLTGERLRDTTGFYNIFML